MEYFFPRIQEKTKKKKFFTRNGTLSLSTDLRSDAHQSQIIGADADEDHTQIIGGYIPHPPLVSAPLPETDPTVDFWLRLSLMFLHCDNVYDTKVLRDPTFEKHYFLPK